MKRRLMDPRRYFGGDAEDVHFGYHGTRKYHGTPVWPEAPQDTIIGKRLASESREALESRGWDVDAMLEELRK